MIPILLLKLARELYKAMSSWRHWTKLINSKENIIRLYTILRLEQIKSVNLFVIVFNSLHFHLSALKRSVLKYAKRNNFEETIWAMAWYFTLGKLKIPPKLSLIFFLLFSISLWWLRQQLFFKTYCICSGWMVTLFKDRARFIYSYYSRKKLKTH